MATESKKNNNTSIKTVFFIFIILLVIAVGNLTIEGRGLVELSLLVNFTTMFISIIIEAFPFVLLGVIISSMIQVFVTEDMLLRWIPKKKFPALLGASLMGIFFPICECANVPVTRRLIAKGVPLHVGITFLMSVAIMNPVVLIATFYAFGGNWRVALLRGLLGMIGAIVIGLIVSYTKNPQAALRKVTNDLSCGCDHDHSPSSDHCCHAHEASAAPASLSCSCHGHPSSSGEDTNETTTTGRKFINRVEEIIYHTSAELFAVGRFLILGAFISSFVQVFLPRQLLLFAGQQPVLSILILMALAYGLSLCSEADAFIAATFVGQFTTGSIMAFMIFGPMIDVKNTLMLLEGFKAKFVYRLIAITSLVCFTLAILINLVGW